VKNVWCSSAEPLFGLVTKTEAMQLDIGTRLHSSFVIKKASLAQDYG
jgi:hypothetical protein